MKINNKKTGLLLLLLLVAGFCFWGLVVKQRVDKRLTIPYSMQKIQEQLTVPENMAKWYLPFAGIDTTQQKIVATRKKIEAGENYLEIMNQSVAGAGITTGNKNAKKIFVFSIFPDTVNKMQCDVQLSYNTTLFKKLFGAGSLEKEAVKSLDNLKAYMEDTKKLYGFQIEQETVVDTSYLFTRRTVLAAEKQAATKKLFEDLISHAEKNSLGYTGARIFYTVNDAAGQVTLFAGIGISKRFEKKAGNMYEYKGMPAGKNLLVAIYQGPFGEVDKAYAALDQFRSDNYLSSMAIPFQKFMNDGYDFADDQVVQMKVYYPIF